MTCAGRRVPAKQIPSQASPKSSGDSNTRCRNHRPNHSSAKIASSVQFSYGQGSANDHMGCGSIPRRSCLLQVSGSRPIGLANVALSLRMEQAGERAAAVRRRIPAKQKFETFLQAGSFLIPQQSRHSPAFARSKLKMCRARVIASCSFPLLAGELDKLRDRSRIAPSATSTLCSTLLRSGSMMAAR